MRKRQRLRDEYDNGVAITFRRRRSIIIHGDRLKVTTWEVGKAMPVGRDHEKTGWFRFADTRPLGSGLRQDCALGQALLTDPNLSFCIRSWKKRPRRNDRNQRVALVCD